MKREERDRQPLHIRQAAARDAPFVIDGINAICAEGGAFYMTRFVATPPWNTVLHNPGEASNHMLAVAEYSGVLVGAGRIFPGGQYSLMQHAGELGIFVLAPFRRRHVGTQLLLWLLDWAGRSNLEKITLSTFASNEPALQFFQKNGFAETGRMRRQIKTGGSCIDLLLMERFL